jgi:GDPmannose 4,6-dehydratase
VKVEPKFYRPAEVDYRCGDPSKAEKSLGWQRQVSFARLVTLMVEADERRVRDNRVTF